MDRDQSAPRQIRSDFVRNLVKDADPHSNLEGAEKYSVAILVDCCTTVDQMIHNIALHALSTRVKLCHRASVVIAGAGSLRIVAAVLAAKPELNRNPWNWSYNRLERLEDYLTERDLIHLAVETVALGGNLHLDVSPCADGTIPMLQQERLVQMGDWLKVNGEAIYGTRRWTTAMKDRWSNRSILAWTRIGNDRNKTAADDLLHPKGRSRLRHLLGMAGKTLALESPITTLHTQVQMLESPSP